MRRLMLALATATLFLVGFGVGPGCTAVGVGVPSTDYVEAHDKYHKAEKYIYDTFAVQNPGEAQTARDMYDSETILIDKAKAATRTTTGGP